MVGDLRVRAIDDRPPVAAHSPNSRRRTHQLPSLRRSAGAARQSPPELPPLAPGGCRQSETALRPAPARGSRAPPDAPLAPLSHPLSRPALATRDATCWAVPPTRGRLSPFGPRRAVPDRLVERDRLRDPLELERPYLAQLKALRLHVAHEVLACKDAVLRCLRRDPRGDVHGSPEVVALVVDHRPSVHTDVRGRQAARTDRVDEFERGPHGVGRITEVKVNSVPEHLDHVSAVVSLDASRGTLTYPCFLERGLHVLELMLDVENVRVAPEEPCQHLFAGVPHP